MILDFALCTIWLPVSRLTESLEVGAHRELPVRFACTRHTGFEPPGKCLPDNVREPKSRANIMQLIGPPIRQRHWSASGLELDVVAVSRQRSPPLCICHLSKAVADSADSSLYGTSSVVGFDSSGHVSEEIQNARWEPSCGDISRWT